ncbi:MAG: bifunctional 5,10-methylene-tetrahydrofolate dehydrogenase/5,10-methylene-tetrahydrofolate cyclohydrolase [Rhodospirillaceae bacterium TMED8]|nr:bifunctional 5,10-methylene-tetrahydrofolate dehydrogenase/5,10-methylene-tetrahydrofolate cyclohydrolase [Magnetovibrio sp.]OUT51582.1 MAG: bifunctional 5,10-methylene-tetrahydrofolate dehydrogenase/5,10-methylene-tetrahydrofolate cyclohydrolase [Rhodospirillaceae bacterium TMED8]|tara:strand:+ start:1296 stop:2225 length:930 start_codon:yes stop_codon:yes gene_type:complete
MAQVQAISNDHKLIDGRAHAARMIEDLKLDVRDLDSKGWRPHLISVTVGEVDEVGLYVRNQRLNAEKAGIEFQERNFPASVTEAELLAAIESMNVDPRITGIIMQRPVPNHISVHALQEAVHPLKDVEGMHPSSIGKIVYQNLETGPCTALAAVELLKTTGLELAGLEVVMVGHSEIVGKPIAFLLMAEGATVTVCHHRTRNLAVHSRQADAVFVAAGKPNLITQEMIKPGAVVIDIGINQVDQPEGKSKVVGDVDFASCADVAGWITPVPGGVGPVTVAVLMRNAVIATQRQKTHYEVLLARSTKALQ